MQSWMMGMVSGVIATGFLPTLPPWSVSPLLLIAIPALLLKKHPVLRFLCGSACGCLLGIAHGTTLLERRLPESCVGQPVTVSGTIASLPVQNPIPHAGMRTQFQFSVDHISPAVCSGPERLSLYYYGNETVVPGERWRFTARLKRPWGLANPGSFNTQVWFAQAGIDGSGSVSQSRPVEQMSSTGGVSGVHHRLRLEIRDRIQALGLSPGVRAVLQAITVADKSGIDENLWLLFQRFGISHLLVISGLHVGMVAAVGYLAGGLLVRVFPALQGGGRRISGVMAFTAAALFAALAGFSLPTQRALAMLGCFVLAVLAGRRSASAYNLLLAAAVVLSINPLAAIGSGFWLSFGSVAALLWLTHWQKGWGRVRRLLGTHAFMSMMMLPMGGFFFAGSSVVGVAGNLVMIPVVGWIVVPLALLASVSFLCGWAIEPYLWQAAGWPLACLLPLAETLDGKGGQWLYLPVDAGLAEASLGILAVGMLILPAGHRFRLLAIFLILPALLPADPAPGRPSLDTELTVLDVGQGTAVVIRSGRRALLYDAGGGNPEGPNMGSRVVVPFLQKTGIDALDTMVVSHQDLDHSAGSAAVLRVMDVDRFRYGGDRPGKGEGLPCLAGEAWGWPGGQTFQFLSPALEGTPERPLDSNDGSCVLQVQVGEYRILLPGDIEAQRERSLVEYWGVRLRSDWLLAAHHGSRTSSSGAILKHVRPNTVVVSSGYANRFGHPHDSVTTRLKKQQATVYGSSEEGALTFAVGHDLPPHVTAYRRPRRYYWM